jgi:hypothetical protein
MKINEIIIEGKVAKIAKRLQQSTVGLNLFRDTEFADRVYELNRVMMAAAMTDGKEPLSIDHESWAGRHNIATPYTKEEQQMLKQAFSAVGSWHKDLNKGDLRSQELPSTHKKSPLAKIKKNKFGI